MRRTWLILTALTIALFPATARGDGIGILGSAASVEAPPYRYVAISPYTTHPVTVVERIDLGEATVDRWWYLRGNYFLPAVAYDRSPGGISADSEKVVLAKPPRGFPPKRSEFAVLDTRLFLSHPRPEGAPRHAVTRFSLPGAFTFDAISPDGSLIYLIQNHFSGRRFTHYEVRALETATGRLLPRPVVDPEEPDEEMQGMPVTRLGSADGRWAYTFYDGLGAEPFVHALDTVDRTAVCIDLPQLEGERDLYLVRMRLVEGGRKIVVYKRPKRQGGAPSPSLLAIDTKSFAVNRPEPGAASEDAAGLPWLPIAAVVMAIGVAAGWRRRARVGQD